MVTWEGRRGAAVQRSAAESSGYQNSGGSTDSLPLEESTRA
jgi:hypothetical protein